MTNNRHVAHQTSLSFSVNELEDFRRQVERLANITVKLSEELELLRKKKKWWHLGQAKRTMARSSTTPDNKQTRYGKCIDCAKGYVMDDGVKGNPLIIECTVTHVRYPQGWISDDGCFSQRQAPMEIHPMIYISKKL